MAQKWFMVDVTATSPTGRRVRYETVVQAESAVDAVIQAARGEWGIDLTHYKHCKNRNGYTLIYCDGYTLDRETLEEMATEVTDPVVLARLDGAPELPLDLGARQRETAAAHAPDAYQRQCLATWGSVYDPIDAQRSHAMLGLAGEVGESADLLKKHFYKPGRKANREKVLDELADVAYYIAIYAHLWGITFDDLFAHLAGKLAGGHGWVNHE